MAALHVTAVTAFVNSRHNPAALGSGVSCPRRSSRPSATSAGSARGGALLGGQRPPPVPLGFRGGYRGRQPSDLLSLGTAAPRSGARAASSPRLPGLALPVVTVVASLRFGP